MGKENKLDKTCGKWNP